MKKIQELNAKLPMLRLRTPVIRRFTNKIIRIYLGLMVLWCCGFMVRTKSMDRALLFTGNTRFQVPDRSDHNTIRPKNHST